MGEKEEVKKFQKLKKRFEKEKEEDIIEFLDQMDVWEGEQKEKIPYEKLPDINNKVREELED
ncbi:MAG: hypothetical protein MUP58_02795 [Candidatus Nanohaloarchaeota archaeon QJJ-9]|nr:hypothetical protein [Candidatus Nanohaloarchaeota archaeon QJJ-9]